MRKLLYVMKYFLLQILLLFFLYSYGQTDYGEIRDKNIQQRVLLIKSRTDSILKKVVNKAVFKRLVPDFGVTYQVGEFYENYLFLNQREDDPESIYDLTQYYSIHDKTIGLADTIAFTIWS